MTNNKYNNSNNKLSATTIQIHKNRNIIKEVTIVSVVF